MNVRYLADMTWQDVERLPKDRAVGIVPIGAVEAHGPHLPLGTDVVIAQAMADAGAVQLEGRGWSPVVLPPVSYTAAPFAAGFSGTVSVSPAPVTQLLVDIAQALDGHGIRVMVLANAHFDPAHLAALREAVAAASTPSLRVVFPDVTRRVWAERLTDEFRSGACHAGQYETSIVMAVRPDLVEDEVRLSLSGNPASLTTAIREGQATFEEAGGPAAYFGNPAAATAEEGHATIEALGAILAEAIADDAA